jgi:hypothetical protein
VMDSGESYDRWPAVGPELLAKIHAELRHNLAAVVVGSPFLEATHVETAVPPRPDEEGPVEYAQLASFYAATRSQDAAAPVTSGGAVVSRSATASPQDYATSLSLPSAFFDAAHFSVPEAVAGEDVFNPFLLAKLSYFLDTVELELVKLTSRNSDAFFSAMSQIKHLHGLVELATAEIRASRGALERTSNSAVRNALSVPNLSRRLANMRRVLEVEQLVAQVLEHAKEVDLLIAGNAFAEAWTLDGVICKRLAQLPGVAALRDVPALLESKMAHMRRLMQSRLHRIVGDAAFNRTEMEAVCLPVFQGLVKSGEMAPVWRELHKIHLSVVGGILSEIVAETMDRKGVARPPPPVRRPLHSSRDANPLYEDEGAETTRVVLSFFAEMELLNSAIRRSTEQVEKFSFCVELLRIVSESDADGREVQDSLHALCVFVQEQIAQVVESNGRCNATLSLQDFSQLYRACNDFALACETFSKRSCHILRGCLLTQAKGFLSFFHAEHVKLLAGALEMEKWVGAKVPSECQLIVDRMCGRRESVQSKLGLWSESFISLNSAKFRVVEAGLVLVRGLSEYLECLDQLPLAAVDMVSLIKSYLSAFNTKCAALVLGAQAVHGMARLKSISTKNLAYCCESIGMASALIAVVKERLLPVLSERQQVLLEDYDILTREFSEHRNKLFAMLVSVMRQMAAGYMSRVRPGEWGAFSDRVSEYVEGITERTMTMHRLLEEILSVTDLERVMSETFVVYNAVLWDAFRGMDVSTKSARKRLRADVALLSEKLSRFDKLKASFGTLLLERVNKAFPD